MVKKTRNHEKGQTWKQTFSSLQTTVYHGNESLIEEGAKKNEQPKVQYFQFDVSKE